MCVSEQRYADVISLLEPQPLNFLSFGELEGLMQSYLALHSWEKAEETARAATQRPEANEQPFIVLSNFLQSPAKILR